MGVLDDAIREHLELKRAHGASEEELKRQEAEALGPARREPVVRPVEEADRPGPEHEVVGRSGTRPTPAEAALAPAYEASVPGDDAEENEVPAAEALEDVRYAAGAPAPADRPARVFDVEELGPPEEEPLGGREEPAGSAAGPAAADPDVEPDEEMLDAEEEAEEELAEELAGAGVDEVVDEPDDRAASGPRPADEQSGRADPEIRSVDEPATRPEPPVAEPDADVGGPASEHASFEDDTIYRPPPAAPADDDVAAGEAETDEYELEAEPVEELPSAEGDVLDEDLVEEEEVLEGDEPLAPGEADEAGPPAAIHVPADEDLDAEEDLELEEDVVLEEEVTAGGGGLEDDEDVLEETPEFLEEAPEDERLWSEQRPPEDFDLGR